MATFVQQVYGPIFVGVMLNVILYGVVFGQMYMYYVQCKKDRTWMKVFVVTLLVFNTVNTAFDIAFAYDSLIKNFGNEDALMRASWLFATDPTTTAVIAVLCQLFFAWRTKVLTSNWFAVIIIAIFAVAQFFSGIGVSIAVRIIPNFLQFQKFEVIVITWLGTAAVCDALIAFVLVSYLRKNKAGMPAMDDRVNKIIRAIVQTGVVTSVWAIVDLILFLVTTSGFHLIFNMSLAKLYTASLLSSLNSRSGWRYESSDPSNGQRPEHHMGIAARSRHVGANMLRQDTSKRSIPQQIYIDVESHEIVDVDMKGSPYREPAVKIAPIAERRP